VSTLPLIGNLLTLWLARYWDDPLEFKPDRFLKPDWNRDAFIGFSGGPRACLGRKYVFLLQEHLMLLTALNRFAETEAVVVLTMLVSRYKLSVKEEPQFAKETFEQRKERVLQTMTLLTLTWVPFSLLSVRPHVDGLMDLGL
jgi:cytochrome P450